MTRTLLAAALLALLAGTGPLVAQDASNDSVQRSAQETYLIRFAEPGLLYNTGQIRGQVATAPSATGSRKLDGSTPEALQYRTFLKNQQDDYLTAIATAIGRSVAPSYRYEVTHNGIALELSASDAQKVRGVPGVVDVRPAGTYELTGDRQPFYIGADAIWNGTAVPANTPNNILRGQGIVVGIVDSGVNIAHPSYAPMDASCGFAQTTNKLLQSRNCIGDATCTAGSPGQDLNGHGSHVAATAAGNVVPAGSVQANPALPATTVQGVAPCASLITYRVCEQSSCDGAAIAAAFQNAILDQVDVVNFSISGGTNPWADNDRFKLDAVNADIFVAASAGNTSANIPNPIGTVNHRGPWVMSIANSTDDRPNQGVNSSIRFTVTSPTPPAGPLAGTVTAFGMGPPPASGAQPIRFFAANALGCTANGGFPAGTFTGAVALIQRGTCPFEEKLNNAQAAGAVAGIIFNNVAGTPAFSPGAATLPSAGLEQAVGEALRDFIVANGGTPTVLNFVTAAREGGVLNAGSLRGPNPSFDITKPDITGPGTNIYDAFVAPQLFSFLTGTSMSGPHVAGAGALVRAVRPTWRPMEVHSALMMTANRNQWQPDVLTPATPDDVGTGMVDLRKAALAGFVLDETFANFLAANPATGGNVRSLNIASMRSVNCQGQCLFSRTIRNTLTVPATWTVSVTNPSANVTIRPIEGFSFNGTTTETRNVTVIVDIAPGTTITTPVFGEVRFTAAGGVSPDLVWTVGIAGTGPNADLVLRTGFEGQN